MGKSCGNTGGTCPYWSESSVAARQMTSLLNSNMEELTNFCSGNHPNTKDRVKLGALIDMKHTIPGIRGIANMLNFQKEAIPEVDKLFQTFDPENEENIELFKNIDISERFSGAILASSRYHKLVDKS